jgi:Skp family chaperone for outer membrane proteins
MNTFLTTIGVGALVAGVVLAGQQAVSGPSLPVGYVSIQRVFTESAEGKAQLARVRELQQRRLGELRTRQQALEDLRQQLAQATNEAVRVQLQQQESQQRTDLERSTAQAQLELQNLQRQTQADVQQRVKGVLDEVVGIQDLQLVLSSDQAVLWSAPGMDLTSEVIERLDTATPAEPPQ